MFKLTIAAFSITATLASAGVAVAETDADDRKILSGNFCQNENDEVRYWRGRTENKSATTAYIDCPITRDITITGGKLTSAWAKVVDRSAVESVECTLWSQDGNDISGWGLLSSRRTPVSHASEAVLTLAFDPLDSIGGFGYYSIDCNLAATYNGARSAILAYMITEH